MMYLGAVYISTEDTFPSPRVIQIAEYFKYHYKEQVGDFNFTDNIFMEEIYNVVNDKLSLFNKWSKIDNWVD